MDLAFYIAQQGKVLDSLISFFTGGWTSHVELVFPERNDAGEACCFSSSIRDKGTRYKWINLRDGKWITVPLPTWIDPMRARTFCDGRLGRKYDFWGALRFAVPFLKQKDNEEFCSEVTTLCLQDQRWHTEIDAHQVSPIRLYEVARKHDAVRP